MDVFPELLSATTVQTLFRLVQFVARNTGQTGPVEEGGGLGQFCDSVSFVAKHLPSLLKYLAGGEGGAGAGGVHGPRDVPVGPHAPGESSTVQNGAAHVTESSYDNLPSPAKNVCGSPEVVFCSTCGRSMYAFLHSEPFVKRIAGPNAPMVRLLKCNPSVDHAWPPQATPA